MVQLFVLMHYFKRTHFCHFSISTVNLVYLSVQWKKLYFILKRCYFWTTIV